MSSSSSNLLRRIIQSAITIFMVACICIIPFGESAFAGRTSMTGDYAKDTLNVVRNLKDTVITPESEQDQSFSKDETVFLITDYISRYRNRSQVNDTLSFTTMQTALNALAGHYKTFPNRQVPENLKNRLDSELSKAEDLISNES